MSRISGRSARAAGLLVAAGLALGACTITSYMAYDGDYDPYLRQRVLDRFDWGETAGKERAMKAALEDRREELGVAYSPDFFRSMGFVCQTQDTCSLQVVKYELDHTQLSYGPAVATTASETLVEDGKAQYTPAAPTTTAQKLVDNYVVSFTPQTVDVAVTSGAAPARVR
ncbi:hypothetical protein HW532_17160 [Kaustia mangrovi]|uniref:Uncharacterized protein n=1 Tax=Kaustia mangrovi TaxID=2593653 RepID=A0A7S8C6J9_9HYPH|nr:hypothetical protein [Kaustia mangrovi]QPC44272.1 hypothetical protein HW532_17160 [Kaustia mangrovi]